MKKNLLVFCFAIITKLLIAQGGWLDIGAKGGYGFNFLVNKNFYSDRFFSPRLSFGYMFGGKIGINFNESHAITIDVTASAFEQKYNYSTLNADSLTRTIYERSLGFNTIDFLVMYRKSSDGGYIEIGPQYSMVTKSNWTDEATPDQTIDVSENINPYYLAGAFGFGGYLLGTDNFRITIGFRASYAFTDLISSKGKQTNFPSVSVYPNYKPTSPLTGLMVLEMNYDIGYFARSKCKKRKLSFLLF